MKALAESLAIQTCSGLTVLFPSGQSLPISLRERFSTAEDDQPGVTIHLIASDDVGNERDLGSVTLKDIPPAPMGVPAIMLTVTVDEAGIVAVRAEHKVPRRQVSAAFGPLRLR